MAWTDEQKAKVITMYEDAEPTAANSTEIVKKIAEDFEQSANGVRMILVQAGVYVKKEAAAAEPTKGATGTKTASTRVSKETSINALKAAIKAKGAEVDDEILDKLTGKAAIYFTAVLTAE